jgi:hypothetical protein
MMDSLVKMRNASDSCTSMPSLTGSWTPAASFSFARLAVTTLQYRRWLRNCLVKSVPHLQLQQ